MTKRILEFLMGNNPLLWIYGNINRSACRVLAYHEVNSPGNFEKHLQYFQKHYQLISVVDLAAALSGNKQLPDRSLLITFDDGERSVYENGLPLFKKYHIPVCMFVVTDYIGTMRPLWWQSLGQLFSGNELIKKTRHFKTLSQSERLQELSRLETILKKKPTYRQLTLQELMEMQDAGVTIGNHTHSHPLLDDCTRAETMEEIMMADKVLKQNHLNGARFFAYPNGNYSADAREAFEATGIELAFLFDHELNRKISDRFKISRLSVNSNTSLDKLKFILSGLHSKLIRLLQ